MPELELATLDEISAELNKRYDVHIICTEKDGAIRVAKYGPTTQVLGIMKLCKLFLIEQFCAKSAQEMKNNVSEDDFEDEAND